MPRRGRLGNDPGCDVHLTPPEIWERLERIAGSVYDPCPHPWTVDGLVGHWPVGPDQIAYVNPPFSALWDWAYQSVIHASKGHTVVVLVPVRSSQPYWTGLSMGCQSIAFWTGDRDHGGKLSRRVRFLNAEGKRQAGAPFDTALFMLTSNADHAARFRASFADVATVIKVRR